MTEPGDHRADHEFDIAVIGLAARFPKSRTAEEFWKNLSAGVECISFFSEEDLKSAGASAETLSRPSVVRAASLLDDIDLFDAEFFGYSPAEARVLDPQQRLFLESAWEALEDAGYAPGKFPGLIGVYAGTGFNSYLLRLLTCGALPPSAGGLQMTLGNDKDYLTTRISYKLNLRGPSVCVQTACSTSLAAVHMACQGLIEHECDLALAGGVAIRSPQLMFYHYQQDGILSPDGHCRTFDSKAAGTIFGNGLGLVVLKRYEEAARDGDHIYALIRGSAMNNDGSLKVGYTAPSVEGQAQVITRALAVAGIDPESISYVEAHGTATHLGDPIEITALKQALGGSRSAGSCALGSVKTNIGHLDTAAGIAGLIKTVLALKHKTLPASLHFDNPNPELHLQGSPFKVQTQTAPWSPAKHPRRAGVSSFGIGGTNVHVVLEEAPAQVQHGSLRQWQLLTLSARTEPALEQMTERIASHLRSHPEINLADVAYTTQVGREAFACRRSFIARNVPEAIEVLEREHRPPLVGDDSAKKPAIVFMFPGQGVQQVEMAGEIYRTESFFRECVDECASVLRNHLHRDTRELFYPSAARAGDAAHELEQTAWAQPALFVVEYALAKLWMEWGIHPTAMIGHSLGELVAACLAGVFSLHDGLAIVAQRGRLMQQMPRGSMIAVALPEAALPPLPPSVAVAAVNAPSLTVLSGPSEAIRDLQLHFEQQKTTCRLLRTSHAYHSTMMEAAMLPFQRAMQQVRLNAPAMPFISCVTGQWITAEQATSPAYWAEQIRVPVRFKDGLRAVASLPNSVLLEVGPGRTLCKIARQNQFPAPLASLPEHEEGGADEQTLLSALGELWSLGCEVQWRKFHSKENRLRVPLPTYPFQRRRFWYNDSPAICAEENLRPAQVQQVPAGAPSPYFRPSWRLSTPIRLAPETEIVRNPEGTWLIFADDAGLAPALAHSLRQKKQNVVTVCSGERFARHDQNGFDLKPGSREDYLRLFRTMGSEGMLPHTIVYCPAVSGKAKPEADIPGKLGNIFENLLALTGEIAKFYEAPVRLFVLCDQLHSITGDEVIDPFKSTVLGICRVAPLEIHNLSCRCIDLVLAEDSAGLHAQADLLMEEMRHESPLPVVAYRGLNRWEMFFDSVGLRSDSLSIPAIREGGVYLITGGLGGIGIELALLLARKYKARLALIGRTKLPEPAARNKWIAEHEENDPVSARLAKIAAMESAGAEVLVLAADVTSQEQMESAIAAVRQKFGEIHGVLHLAAIPGGGLLLTRTAEAAYEVLAPKIQGALILEELLRGQKLDFLLLFSSTLAITGAVGQADYCAANAFLTAFAASRQHHSATPIVAVDWDGWLMNTWQQRIQAFTPEVYQELQQKRERFGIGIEEGLEMIEHAIQAALPQIIVSKQDFPALVSRLQAASQAASGGRQNEREPQNRKAQNKDPHSVKPRNHTEETIVQIWQEILGVPEVGVNDNFFQLGGHSLFAIQIAAQIREKFQVELEMRKMLEQPTVAALAALVESARAKSESEADEIMALLDDITRLSPAEVHEQLSIAATKSS